VEARNNEQLYSEAFKQIKPLIWDSYYPHLS
jgi:hypothetical protein